MMKAERMRNDPNYKSELRLALAELLGVDVGRKHNATGTPTTTYAHGPSGLFSYPGVDPKIFSAMLGTVPGIVAALPKNPSQYTNPLYTSITGVQDDIGANPTNVCDPAKTAGLMKSCTLTSVFGRYSRQTRELYINRIGQLNDPADPMYIQMMNAPDRPEGDAFLAPGGTPSGPGGNVINNEIMKVLFEFGVSVNRQLCKQAYLGNPTNNTSGEGYKEMTGLEILVATGKADAITNTACPALDPDIKNFNYALVTDSTANIVRVLTYLYRFVKNNAMRSGLMPVQWVFVMREELWYELSSVWPISYLTQQTAVISPTIDRLVVSGREVVDERDAMREGRYLTIDGQRIEVILDDGITENTNTTNSNVPSGQFSSDIYLLPLTVMGGIPSLYMEYFNHDNPQIAGLLGDSRMANQVWTTNGGAWIWSYERKQLCFFYWGKVEPRMVLRTPQLAGRVQNVRYSPLQHTRQPFPSDPYFANGGITSRTGPSYYRNW